MDNSPTAGTRAAELSGSARNVAAMTNLITLSDAVAPAREKHRELIDAARAWRDTIPTAHPVHPDRFALICAAADAARDPDIAPTRWTRVGTYHLVRIDIPNWCSRHRCLWPEEMLVAMWEWLDFLHATGRLDPASDPVAELRKPLICYGWFDQDGAPLPEGVPRQVECECFLPYRETVNLLGELVSQAERSGEPPVDTLRRLIRGR